jgi:hypothetical protein
VAGITTRRLLLLRNLRLGRSMKDVCKTWWWTALKINVIVSYLFL